MQMRLVQGFTWPDPACVSADATVATLALTTRSDPRPSKLGMWPGTRSHPPSLPATRTWWGARKAPTLRVTGGKADAHNSGQHGDAAGRRRPCTEQLSVRRPAGGEIACNDAHVRVLGAEALLVDGQRPLDERLGLAAPVGGAIEQGQMVEACGHLRVLGRQQQKMRFKADGGADKTRRLEHRPLARLSEHVGNYRQSRKEKGWISGLFWSVRDRLQGSAEGAQKSRKNSITPRPSGSVTTGKGSGCQKPIYLSIYPPPAYTPPCFICFDISTY